LADLMDQGFKMILAMGDAFYPLGHEQALSVKVCRRKADLADSLHSPPGRQ
jgi:hypothetical protein